MRTLVWALAIGVAGCGGSESSGASMEDEASTRGATIGTGDAVAA